jgi:hypothetical protein
MPIDGRRREMALSLRVMMSVSCTARKRRVPAAPRLLALATCRDAAALARPNELAAVVVRSPESYCWETLRCRRGRLIESPRGLRQLGGLLLAAARFASSSVRRSRDADMLAVATESYTRASLMRAPVNLLYPSRFPGNPHVVVVVITNYNLQRFRIN